ncbi:DUF6233 domain-containing protein [Streptomyces sp. NPDC001787]|uniref:DUF6233 domain-containing protein n=1 Tax=Streptomyces sp. NPDC001787 TaxID=3154523 RepID=UPI00331A0F63
MPGARRTLYRGGVREERPAGSAPLVDVTMPDGLTVRGRLYSRRQTESGWLLDVGIVLWRAVDPDRPEPGEYRAWMPASSASPVAGADYDPVPRIYLTRDIPPPPPSSVQPPPPPQSWIICSERRPSAAVVRPTRVHRADCWSADEGVEVTTEQKARAAMRLPGAHGCRICGTDMSLRDHPRDGKRS